jgi:ATP-dependent Zn protease
MNGNNNQKQGPGNRQPKMPTGSQFVRNILSVIFILLLLVTLYSVIAENRAQREEISISQLANDITAGKVTQVTVDGDNLEVHYDVKNEVIKRAKKEEGTALTDTLVNYGVTPNPKSKRI